MTRGTSKRLSWQGSHNRYKKSSAIYKEAYEKIFKKKITNESEVSKMKNKVNELVKATNILEMVLLGASDLTDEITKQNLTDADYKRIKRDIKDGYKFLREYYKR